MANELFIPLLMAMATASYGLRIAGFLMMRVMPVSPRLDAALRATPLGVMAGIVALAAMNGGLAEWLAIALVMIVQRISGNDVVAAFAGVASLALIRAYG